MHISNEVTTLPIVEAPDSLYSGQLPAKEKFQPVDPNNPVWGIGGALLIWIVSILLQTVIQLFFIIPFAVHRGLDPGSPDFAKSALQLAVTDRTGVFLQVLSILPTHIFTFALVWTFITRFGKRPFRASLGWGWSQRLGLWQSMGLGIALFGTATLLVVLFGAEKPTQLEQIINSSTGARYALAAMAVLTAPFIEEFIYRGVLYSAVQRTLGVRVGIVFVSGLFTAIHVPQYWPNFGVISAVALLSVVLTCMRAYSGRLLPCIFTHMAFNAVQAALLVFGPFIERFLPTAEPPAPTTSILLPLIRLIGRAHGL